MVQIEDHNWERLELFFDKVDIPFLINDWIDNALEDFIVNLSHVSDSKVESYMKEARSE